MINLSIGGRVENSHTKWMGKWYKPWTWTIFSDKYVYFIIHDFKLIECSIVSNPVNPDCRFKYKDGL